MRLNIWTVVSHLFRRAAAFWPDSGGCSRLCQTNEKLRRARKQIISTAACFRFLICVSSSSGETFWHQRGKLWSPSLSEEGCSGHVLTCFRSISLAGVVKQQAALRPLLDTPHLCSSSCCCLSLHIHNPDG